jgi:hypothetical protein
MHDEEGRREPELTIVGGEPGRTAGPRPDEIEVPVGFEMVLLLAARDARFRDRLLADRDAALAGSDIALRPSEAATLRAISRASLAAMIDRLVPENPWGRQLMGKVAAAVATLAAGTVAATACTETQPAGHDDTTGGATFADNGAAETGSTSSPAASATQSAPVPAVDGIGLGRVAGITRDTRVDAGNVGSLGSQPTAPTTRVAPPPSLRPGGVMRDRSIDGNRDGAPGRPRR